MKAGCRTQRKKEKKKEKKKKGKKPSKLEKMLVDHHQEKSALCSSLVAPGQLKGTDWPLCGREVTHPLTDHARARRGTGSVALLLLLSQGGEVQGLLPL